MTAAAAGSPSRPASAASSQGLGELPEAFRQAQRAVEIGRRVHGGGSVTRFDQLGLHRLLALVPDGAELTSFAADVLGPLAERTPEAADLRETLQVLLDTNFNVAEAARAQFFHYNTMRYRVGKLRADPRPRGHRPPPAARRRRRAPGAGDRGLGVPIGGQAAGREPSRPDLSWASSRERMRETCACVSPTVSAMSCWLRSS